MTLFTILFYFGSGMFVSLVVVLGLSLLFKRPGAIAEHGHDRALRSVGGALLLVTFPVVLELFRDYFPMDGYFIDYIVPSLYVCVTAVLIWLVFSFVKHGGYSMLPFVVIGLSGIAVFMVSILTSNVVFFLVSMGVWLLGALVCIAVQSYRNREVLKSVFRTVDGSRNAWLLAVFVWCFLANPYFLYLYISIRSFSYFSVFFSLTWMAMGLVVLFAVTSNRIATSPVDAAPNPIASGSSPNGDATADDPDRRTASDYFSPDQQQDMKLQLEKMMTVDKFYRSPDLCVSDLVKRFDTNASYFYYFMRDVMHASFFDYVNGFRVEEAKELLQKGEKVDYIIYRVGFNSDTTFRRAFKRVTGLTPSEWRAQNIKGEVL